MEVHSHGLETLGVNKDADKVFNPELKDILAPPSSQVSPGENFTATPSAHSAETHGKVEVPNNTSVGDTGAAPTATFSFPPAPSDLNNAPSDINFQPYESVVIEQNSQHETHQVCEQDEAFDDMVILEDGMVTSASLSGGGAGDGLDTFRDADIQMEDFQQADVFNPASVAADAPIEMNVGEKPEITSSVADAGVPVMVTTETTIVSEVVVVQELPTALVEESPELTAVEASHDFPLSHDKDMAANDSPGVQVEDGELVPKSDVVEAKVEDVTGAAEVVNPAGLDGDTVQKSEPESHEVTEKDVKALKGQKVFKKFGKKNYGGEVTDYDPETKWFKVVYEDGDDEDLELWEVKRILASSLSSPSSSKKRARTEGDGDETSQKSSKKPRKSGTAKKTSKSYAKSPKTPGSKAKGSRGGKQSSTSTSTKGRSPGKLIKKALEASAFKTPVDSQIKEGKGKGKTGTSTANKKKGGSSRKTKTVSRSLNLQSPKTQKKGNAKVDAESSGSKKATKSPKQQTTGMKRTADGRETTAEKSKRTKKGVAEAEDASILGKHVRKDFDGTIYDGVVVKHDIKTGFYKVKYEDGDQEDLEMHELEPILQEAGSLEEKEEKPAKHSSLASLMSEGKKGGPQKRKIAH